jgi:hypothetical protein
VAHTTSSGDASNRKVHEAQVAALRWEATHPRDSEAAAYHLTRQRGRGFLIGRAAATEFRACLHGATLEALTHDAQSPEWVAARIVEAAERILCRIGVERMP